MAGNKSATLTIVIAGDAKGLSKSLKGTESQVASLGAQFKKMAGAVGIGLGTAAVIKFGKDSVSSYANAGREVLKLKRLTGDTAEEASLLRFAAMKSGLSVEQMAKAWVIFSKNIQSGKIEAAGIAIKGVNGEALSSTQILGNAADKFAGMQDGYEKTALAATLFGKSGAALLPFLNKGAAGVTDLKAKMDQLGVSFDEAGLQKVKDYTAAQRDMSAAVEGLKLKIGSGLIPIITSLTETVSNDLPKVTAAVGGIGDVLGKVGDATGLGSAVGAIAPPLLIAGAAVTALGGAILILGPALTAGTAALSGLGAAALTTATNLLVPTAAVEGLAAAETTATATTEAFSLSLGSVTAVLVAGVASYNLTYKALEKISGQAPAVQELVDALKGIGPAGAGTSKVLADLGTSADELANGNVYKASTAWAELDASLSELAKTSPKEAQQAMVGLTVAMSAQGMTVDDINERLPRLTAALDGTASSTKTAADEAEDHAKKLKKEADEAKRVAELQAHYAAELDRAAEAQKNLETAGENVNAAIVGVAEAHDKAAQAAQDEKDAEEAATQADRAVVSAKRAVQDAIDQVAQARRAEEANIRSLADAEKGEAQAAKDVAQAQADLAQKRREATGDSDTMRSALGRVVDAEKALRQADEDSEAAQRRLTEARQNYGNVIADLQDKATSSQLDVNDAQRRLREAQQNLANLGKDGKPVTGDDRGAAQDAVTRAEIALRQAQKDAAAAQAELNKEQKAGADGSTAVVDAQDAVTAAAQHQADAHRDLETAVQNVADTQVAADKAVADAESTLADKIDARQAAHQRVLDAKQAVVDGNAAIQKAVEGVRDAEQQAADAQGDANKAHQEVVTKKDAVTGALGEIATAEWGVAMAYAAEADARKRIADLASGANSRPPGVGGGPHGHETGDRSSAGSKTPADANAPTKGTKDSGGATAGGKSSGGEKGRASTSAKGAAAGGTMGDPSIYHRPGSGTGWDWTDPAAAPVGPPGQGQDGDYYAYAKAHPPKGVKQLRRPPREIHNTFHLYGVTDMQTQATLIAREQSLQLALAGGH